MRLPTAFADAAAPLEALAKRTSLGVGGRPELLLEPRSAAEARRLVLRCVRAGVPVRFLGGGTNLLVRDEGVAGAVVATRRLRGLQVGSDVVRAEAGVPFPQLVRRAAALRVPVLSGLAGIPGSVGGAVTMNAGGRHGAVSEALVAVEGIGLDGRPFRRAVKASDFGYRQSPFAGALITAATFRRDASLCPATADRLRLLALEAKRRTQPVGTRSAGCVFKNPEGDSAGRLIDQGGFKGLTEGGAMVSEAHANFILNVDRATAADIQALIDRIREDVRIRTGRELELEVRRWS